MVSSTAFGVSGAVYTTYDASQGGCLDNPTGVNCNNYNAREDVYITGGPSTGGSGLSEGDYYFTVVVPGYQNGGFVDGADGNLSDTTAGITTGDAGSGDLLTNRTFHVDATGNISSYSGNHASSIPGSSNYDAGLVSLQGKLLIQLMPYDLTSNSGGVYILAVCSVGATLPSECKYDAFRIKAADEEQQAMISGLKYYDVNTNGVWDGGEVGIPNWPIVYYNVSDLINFSTLTGTDGTFSVVLAPGNYHFAEVLGASPWVQTGNVSDQSTVSANATVILNGDKSYDISITGNSIITGINFGNVCLGAGGGKTLGFWSNRNGQALIGADDLAMLVALNLRNATGANFDPATYTAFRTWILGASATNMAYMLSAQLAAMELNVYNGLVVGSALIYAPGANSANINGFATVNDVMNEANTELGLHGLVLAGDPNRAYQEALKNALDKGNNNLNFVQPSPAFCPLPPALP
jgi:hypothetical protein